MIDHDPDSDTLSRQVQAEETRHRRGTLKIFFGYAAGVGKTYSMLVAAWRAVAAGRDVVVGYVEPHSRPETQSLLLGLEAIPPLLLEHRGVPIREFDADAALARRPDLILVDELAHDNAEGCRNGSRWQDVEELLEAGIHVWTTLNAQQIDGLNDVIGRVTGATVRETVPDRVFERADDLELVDITPEELIGRLKAGKVFVPEHAERALSTFFQRANLLSLREISLRQSARHGRPHVNQPLRERSVSDPRPAADRLLACMGPSPSSARVLRTAKRLAVALDAPWVAVSVEQERMATDPALGGRMASHYQLAERLGAEVVTLSGEDVAATLLDYARSRNVTRILVGKTGRPRLLRLLFGSIAEDLLNRSGDIDVYVVRGEGEPAESPSPGRRAATTAGQALYAWSLLVMAVGVMVAALLYRLGLDEANVVMPLLAAVALVASRFGRGPSIMASVLAVLSFDFFFVSPRFTFAVADGLHVPTFGIMLAIALLISTLAARLKAQAEGAKVREDRATALYELGRQLSSISGGAFLAAAAGRKVAELTGGEVAVYLGKSGEIPEVVYGQKSSIVLDRTSGAAARWAIEHDQMAGAGTDVLPNAAALILPLSASRHTVGALAVKAGPIGRLLEPDERRLLISCASQLTLAVERDQMSLAASEAMVQSQTEQVRSALLSGVSHDLRSPLAAIAEASSGLLQSESVDESTRHQLLATIADESRRLSRLLENILQMSRLELGGTNPRMQWKALAEIVNSAIVRVRPDLGGHEVVADLSPDLPLILVDGSLLGQLFVNLLENAARLTPPGKPVTIRAHLEGRWLEITVADSGPGLPKGSEERIFEKFFRGSDGGASGRGSGLGLSVCRGVARVHGGSITARNRSGGTGAEFILRLPLSENPPRSESDAG